MQRSNEQSVIAYFLRHANGYPYALKYNGATYYYITNLQGDVMYLVDANENTVASYEYDPYGNIVSATGTMAQINPLRYRGYYYDAELEMYYLQSRYYDPQICRFINADVLASTGQGVIGCNMFAYCVNNPIYLNDPHGNSSLLPYLTLSDYQKIHSMVQLKVQMKKGWATEVGVRTDRKNGYKFGRLDLFDPDTNTYYEVKSIGSAFTKNTRKQMERYDKSKICGVWSLVFWQKYAATRGTEYVSGSFSYGMWDVEYSLQAPGLIVYTPTYNWRRAGMTTAVIVLAGAVAVGVYYAGIGAGALILLPG